MNYHNIYEKLIEKCKSSNYDGVYVEKHHIIPRCLGGPDISENLVTMSAREHFVAHQLLYKMYNLPELLYAINMMTVHNSDNRNNNKTYYWHRKKFSENHPCKSDIVKDKISKTLKLYYSSEEYDKIKTRKFIENKESVLCACGCGKSFIKYKSSTKKYLNSDHVVYDNSKIDYGKCVISLKRHLSSLSDDQMKNRLENSLWKFDNIERGRRISISKKGKKTNQQNIMGERYASMTDEQFNNFLKTKNVKMWNRMINLRKKYL